MQVNLLYYSVGLGFLVILTAGIAYQALITWHKPGSRTFSLLMLSMTIWAAFYLLEIIVPSLPLKIAFRKALYLGMTMSAPLWLGFALRYSNMSAWWSKRGMIFLLAIPGIITFILGVTNETHGLIWPSLELSSENGLGPLKASFGPGFWLYTAVAYGFIAIGILIY
ncbi:MAG: histidine kinase N-terminal 7TM domain-containing protein, partial [Anaerolineales bacterium]|nr:histidine kinase N-terminal 7TM domain-containing protein [Anaerolineales bacterium]